MAKRCIGIDISSCYLHAVQIVRAGQRFRIEKVFKAQTRRSTDSPSDILRSLINQHGFDRRANVAISMPNNAVFFRDLETDLAGLEQILEKSSSVLENNFPIQTDEIITQIYSHRQSPDENYSVLLAAVARNSLRERLNILTKARIHPNLVDAGIFAIHSAVAVNHPEIMTGSAIIAYIDESYITLAVTQNNDILIVRNIPIVLQPNNDADSVQEQIAELISRETQITWRKVFGAEIEQESKIYLATESKLCKGIEAIIEANLHCHAIIVDPYARVKRPPDPKADPSICVAEGLALRVLAPEQTAGINFLEADNADMKPAFNLKKEVTICAALVVAIACFWLIGLFMQLSHLETNYTNVRSEIREIFQRTLPNEKNIVSPLAQLEQKLDSFRKDYQLFATFHPTGSSPLEVLHSISINSPLQANLEVDDLLIASDSARISGTCDSFESVYQWQRLLQEIPEFSFVEVQDVQKEPKSGAVRFTILLSLAGQK